MKVALYVGELAPTSGGGFTYVSDVARSVAHLRSATEHKFIAIGSGSLPPAGWDPTSYAPLWGRLGSARQVVGSKPVRRLRRRHLDGLIGFWATRRKEAALAALDVDFVWCLGPVTPTLRLPYAATVWDLQHRLQPIFPEVSSDGEWARRERAASTVLGQAAMVIVGTEAGRREVEHFYGVPRSRIRKLPHPTPTFALPTAGNALPPSHERAMPEPYVVYPAQFWAHKNHVGLLRAIAILRDVHDARLHLALVGSDKGSETHVRRAARELNLEDQVHFLGFVARESLVSLYRGALALAYVSYFGPENLPPLEAFALGCPVVAGDVSGAREQLGSAALLVPPSDPRAIADALLSIHRDQSLRLDLISRGVERAAAYTSDSYALDMFRILDELEPVIRTWR